MDPETQELRALEEEVAALQRECSMLPQPGEMTPTARKSFQKFPHSESEECKSLKDLESQLGHLKSELSFLSKLTGINIKNYSKIEDITSTEVSEKAVPSSFQRFSLLPSWQQETACYTGATFYGPSIQTLDPEQNSVGLVSFLLDSNSKKLSARDDHCMIIMWKVKYNKMLEKCTWETEAALRAEEKRDLLMFFRSLHFFVEWYEYRKNTFKHFKCL
ncbi:centromere protein P [Sigmodon hispidus]